MPRKGNFGAMFSKAIEFYKKISRTRKPENSVSLRLYIFLTVTVAILALISQGAYKWAYGLPIELLVAVGYLISYHRREHSNWQLKLLLSFTLPLILVVYLNDLSHSGFDPRIPLARLFIWLQVVHSFDLPERKDLYFSLGSGAVLMTTAAVLSNSISFIFGSTVFWFLFLFSLRDLYLSEAREFESSGFRIGETAVLPKFFKYSAAVSFSAFLATLVLSLMIFPFLPRLKGFQLRQFPISMPNIRIPAFSGMISNPFYGKNMTGLPNKPLPIDPDNYFGLNSFLDLRTRGRLSDNVVLKTRGSDGYLRGAVFAKYKKYGWELQEIKGKKVAGRYQPIELPPTRDGLFKGKDEDAISVFVETAQSNIILAPYKPLAVYFPVNHIWIDRSLSLRSPILLDEGMIYSILLKKPATDREKLAEPDKIPAGNSRNKAFLKPYLSKANISGQVSSLAKKISAGKKSNYLRALAMEKFLKQNYIYDLSLPFQPKDEDSVDYFFRQKRGYCEQFASTFALMARAVDIPSRVITGYLPGQYNPFTGMSEIKASDAHAWVELYFDKAGWVEFDPTPGFEVPDINNSGWYISEYFNYLKQSDAFKFLNKTVKKLGAAIDSSRTFKATALSVTVLGSIGAVSYLALKINAKKVKIDPDIKKYLRFYRKQGFSRNEYETLIEFYGKLPDSETRKAFKKLIERYYIKKYGR
jgi:hypothetical protein